MHALSVSALTKLARVSGSMLEIEPTTEVDKKWTVHENNNQSKRRLLIRISKLIYSSNSHKFITVKCLVKITPW